MTEKEMIDRAYTEHRQAFEVWEHGEPVRAWHEEGCDICIEYESGKWWHYKDLELPFISWWQDLATNIVKELMKDCQGVLQHVACPFTVFLQIRANNPNPGV